MYRTGKGRFERPHKVCILSQYQKLSRFSHVSQCGLRELKHNQNLLLGIKRSREMGVCSFRYLSTPFAWS